jgi:hypothetical protein
MKSAFLLSLLATAALAQPFVSPEKAMPIGASSAFATRIAPAMALVPDGNGFIAAWSAGAGPCHIYAARLNASFEPVAIRELEPFLGTAYDAIDPDIAAVDGGYALVWLERERIDQPRAAAVILRRLSPTLEPSSATMVTWTGDNGIARIAGGDARAVSVLVPQGFVYTVDLNGGSSLAKVTDWTIEDAAVAHGAPVGVTAVEYLPPQYTYFPLCGWPCPFTSPHWSLKVKVDRSAFATTFSDEVARPAVGFGGGVVLVTWLSDVSKPVGQINAVRIPAEGQLLDNFKAPRNLGSYTPGGASMRPSIAWDGERFLIAWPSGSDIVGATLMPDGRFQNFTLAAAPARNPIVIGIKPGRFALAYEVQIDPEHRQLNFRYVDFKVFRQRPSR